MIRQITGAVLETDATSITVEVAGFGVEVCVPAPNAFGKGMQATLATHLAVKQDGMELYGFASTEDRDFFEKLLTVSGVGPKTALGVLRRAPREAIARAIAARDLSYLTKIVGLGKKLAEKMAVELGEKVGNERGEAGQDSEVFDTLVALGYTEREARKAVQAIPDTIMGKDARLRAALSRTTP